MLIGKKNKDKIKVSGFFVYFAPLIELVKLFLSLIMILASRI
jgi:hypothetical protein